jgi:hypothetical protein
MHGTQQATDRPSPTVPPRRGRVAGVVRAAGSLLLVLAGAVALAVGVGALVPVLHPDFTQAQITQSRGMGLIVATVMALVFWGAPSAVRSALARRSR